ncbi:MAG: peptidylprolyl isomerase, partial [Oligoflexus sp.]|nr:peptidylprolyl isomerase [Pseudopedobacter sp.]
MSKAIIKTAKGDMTVEFYDNDAPKTVENFKKLAKEG